MGLLELYKEGQKVFNYYLHKAELLQANNKELNKDTLELAVELYEKDNK